MSISLWKCIFKSLIQSLVIGLLKMSISSCISYGSWHLPKNLSLNILIMMSVFVFILFGLLFC